MLTIRLPRRGRRLVDIWTSTMPGGRIRTIVGDTGSSLVCQSAAARAGGSMSAMCPGAALSGQPTARPAFTSPGHIHRSNEITGLSTYRNRSGVRGNRTTSEERIAPVVRLSE